MSITWNNLVLQSNTNIQSFIILEKTQCMRQVNDIEFEYTNDYVNKISVYDGELLLKKNNKIYLFLGFDDELGYEVYIPITISNNQCNIDII